MTFDPVLSLYRLVQASEANLPLIWRYLQLMTKANNTNTNTQPQQVEFFSTDLYRKPSSFCTEVEDHEHRGAAMRLKIVPALSDFSILPEQTAAAHFHLRAAAQHLGEVRLSPNPSSRRLPNSPMGAPVQSSQSSLCGCWRCWWLQLHPHTCQSVLGH